MPLHKIVAPASTTRLQIEFGLFFVAAPLLIAVFLPATVMFTALFALTAIGLVLLHATDGFHWRDLRYGWSAINWWKVAKFAAMMLALCLLVISVFAPDQMFSLLKRDARLMVMIFLLYPLVSALPQEIVYRPLFFRRYGAILPAGQGGLILNAGLFSMAHLMYWSWIVAAMTFAGGLVFAWAYEKQQNFPLAVVLHGIAGNLIFLTGLGLYFYSGNVTRPF